MVCAHVPYGQRIDLPHLDAATAKEVDTANAADGADLELDGFALVGRCLPSAELRLASSFSPALPIRVTVVFGFVKAFLLALCIGFSARQHRRVTSDSDVVVGVAPVRAPFTDFHVLCTR